MKDKILPLVGIFLVVIIIFVISQKWLIESIIILRNTGLHDRVGLELWAIPPVISFIFLLLFTGAGILLEIFKKNQGFMLESFIWGLVIGITGGAVLGFILYLGLGTPGFISALNFSLVLTFICFFYNGVKKEIEYVDEI